MGKIIPMALALALALPLALGAACGRKSAPQVPKPAMEKPESGMGAK